MVEYDDIAENKITIFDKGIERSDFRSNMDYDNPTTFNFNHRLEIHMSLKLNGSSH